MNSLQVGQRVYAMSEYPSYIEGDPMPRIIPLTVSRVGRKWFEVEEYWRKEQFSVETGKLKDNEYSDFKAVYFTEQAICDYVNDARKRRAEDDMRNRLASLTKNQYTWPIEKVKAVLTIIQS